MTDSTGRLRRWKKAYFAHCPGCDQSSRANLAALPGPGCLAFAQGALASSTLSVRLSLHVAIEGQKARDATPEESSVRTRVYICEFHRVTGLCGEWRERGKILDHLLVPSRDNKPPPINGLSRGPRGRTAMKEESSGIHKLDRGE